MNNTDFVTTLLILCFRELGNISTWDDSVLHNIVDSFLQLRFPMLLVLNKSDSAEAATHIQRIGELNPDIVSIPVSARSECILQRCARFLFLLYLSDQDRSTVVQSSNAVAPPPNVVVPLSNVVRSVDQRSCTVVQRR